MDKLSDVKVGDKLLVRTNYTERIEMVERVTETLVITERHRFKKNDGYESGSSAWGYMSAKPATEEEVKRVNEENRRNSLASKCNGIRFENLSLAQLEEILKIAENKQQKITTIKLKDL